MATNTLIQKLFAVDEVGVGEESTLDSNRQQIETFRCGEAIAAGATVSLDVSQASNGLRAMCVSEADAADYIPVGIAVSAGAIDSFIEITIRGIVEEAKVKGDVVTVAAGDRLVIGTAGKLEKAPSYRSDQKEGNGGAGIGAVTQQNLIVAIAMEAQAGDATSRVFVLNNY
tara:strand:+ start:3828 stop:4340 length:513 start_codon:yes stop_codon:yes gene_type:complete